MLRISRIQIVAGLREFLTQTQTEFEDEVFIQDDEAEQQPIHIPSLVVKNQKPLETFELKSQLLVRLNSMQKQTIPENPTFSDYISFQNNQASLAERLPGFVRLANGCLKCIDRNQLDPQKGIVTDLIAKAGKQLLEGKNVVGISLPVRIFEPRSTLERITDC